MRARSLPGGAYRIIIPAAKVTYTLQSLLGIPAGRLVRTLRATVPITDTSNGGYNSSNNGVVYVGPNGVATWALYPEAWEYPGLVPVFDYVDPGKFAILGTQAGDVIYVAWGGLGPDDEMS